MLQSLPFERQWNRHDEGISENYFESFTRADDKRTSKIQGTGLGMTIVRNIVNMMNGNIKIESEPGREAVLQ